MYNTLMHLTDLIDASEKKYDKDMIIRAYHAAEIAHKGQFRTSGEEYVTHPIEVACILAELGMDTDCLCAALLHDVVEDTEYTVERVEKEFNKDIALMVDGVTKLGKIPLSTKEEQQAENVRKMLLAMVEDIRVMIIKLADRLHNMRTLESRDPQKQRDTSLETMEIYAPLAHRLGIRAMKEELEDLALKYLDPIAMAEINETLQIEEDKRPFIEDIKLKILGRLNEYGITPHIEGRVKSHYGIYRKVYMAGRDFAEVFDIFAVRVIVSTVNECYNILGIVHDTFIPIPNRFKDYISTPKPNMYQSLHTTVISDNGIPFEIQIRTWDMHYTAEYGIAAHWKYKAGIQGKDKMEERLSWIRQLLDSTQETDDARDILRSIKNDIGSEEVFVFTPQGELKSLPTGSTVIDFAYAIHSAVGNSMVGAKIDGRIVQIDKKVKTGQIVEILTTKAQGHGPSRNWLKIVKSNEARSKIRAWFKKERREENVAEGMLELQKEFKRNLINLPDDEMQEFIEKEAKRQRYESIDDFYAAIGYGGVILSRIIQRIKDDYAKIIKNKEPTTPQDVITTQQATTNKSKGSGVIVEGIDNCLVKFSGCCTPLPGDEIIGFITRGYGVSVHKRSCVNVVSGLKDEENRERFVSVHWIQNESDKYRSKLEVIAVNRPSLVADVAVTLSEFRVPIYDLIARDLKNSNASIVATIEIKNTGQLDTIIERLKKIEEVITVGRYLR